MVQFDPQVSSRALFWADLPDAALGVFCVLGLLILLLLIADGLMREWAALRAQQGVDARQKQMQLLAQARFYRRRAADLEIRAEKLRLAQLNQSAQPAAR